MPFPNVADSRKTPNDYNKILQPEKAAPPRWCGFVNQPLRTASIVLLTPILPGRTMPATIKPMKKRKKSSNAISADQATEEIVQMIAQSIASLPKRERLAAMQAFDLTATAISSHGRKARKLRKPPASRPPRKSRKPRKGN